MDVLITSKSKASKRLWSNTNRPRALISINDPAARLPSGWRHVPMNRSLHLEFHDATDNDSDDWIKPTEEDVLKIIKFAERMRDEVGTLLIHCFAGLCRSTAAGFIVFCEWFGEDSEEEAMKSVFESSTEEGIVPNELMVQIADDLMNRKGKMIDEHVRTFQCSRGMY